MGFSQILEEEEGDLGHQQGREVKTVTEGWTDGGPGPKGLERGARQGVEIDWWVRFQMPNPMPPPFLQHPHPTLMITSPPSLRAQEGVASLTLPQWCAMYAGRPGA